MADEEQNSGSVESPASMSETSDKQPEKQVEEGSQEQPQQNGPNPPPEFNTSFSIWPPSQRTREAITNRLIDTLSKPSVLSNRYGTVPHDEAVSAARFIESDSFSAAASSAAQDAGSLSSDAGIEILQAYSREISKRMLESVKSRFASAAPSSAASAPDLNASSASDADATASEEPSSSVVTES